MNNRVILFLFAITLSAVPALAQMGVTQMPEAGFAGMESGVISGMVVGSDGHGIRDARIEVHDAFTGKTVASGYTMPNGSFSFGSVHRGQYDVVATQGLNQVHQRIDCSAMVQPVTLQILSGTSSPETSGGTVSVAELKVSDKAKHEFQKAQQAFDKHKYDEARAHTAKSLAIAPDYSRALTLSGLLDLTDNKVDSARQKLEKSVLSDYGYGFTYIVLGATYNAVGRYDDALRTLDRAMPLEPTSWQAYFEVAKAQLGKGDFQHALASSNRALTLAPQAYAPLHLVRAHSLLGLKAYSEAVAELEMYLGGDPNGVDSVNARKTLDEVKSFMESSKK